jgi:AbrB family looped-hinge helix DNA binding protein
LFQTLRLALANSRPKESSNPFLMVYGIVNGMELRIDKAGRIVVPKPLRERLGFKPDTELVAIEQPEGVLLKRVEQRPSMIKVDGLWVHQGSAEPGANWERILEDVREERIESVLKA